MKTLLHMTMLQFKILLRDRGLLAGSLGLAVVSMVVFGLLFGNNKARPLSVGLVDLDQSPASTQIVAAMSSNEALDVTTGEQAALVDALKRGQHSAVVVLQPGFGAGLREGNAPVQLYIDNSDLVGAARARGIILGTFDAISKQRAGFHDLIVVDEQQVAARPQRQIDVLTPGMLGLSIMFANMFTGIAVLSWRERGTLKRLSATPLKAWQLIGGQILSQLALSFVQVAIILGLAQFAFNVQISATWLPLIALFTVAGTWSIIALGYAVGNFVEKREAAQSVVTLIAFPMMFLGGSYFPVDPPSFLQPVVQIMPLTHLNSAFRQIMLNDAKMDTLWLNLLALLAFGAVLLALSLRTFRWSRRN